MLLVFGLLLAGSSAELSDAIGQDPIGALAATLPTWFLVPFALVAVLGLVGGAVLDIYSSGLALLSLGLRIPRWSAALVDGVIMVLGWGLVTNSNAEILTWQGFLLGPLGLGGRDGAWAYANLGVLVALAVGFAGTLLLERSWIRAQEDRVPRA